MINKIDEKAIELIKNAAEKFISENFHIPTKIKSIGKSPVKNKRKNRKRRHRLKK